jgi:hypothetical protein
MGCRSLITSLDATPPNYVYKLLYYVYVYIYVYKKYIHLVIGRSDPTGQNIYKAIL